MLSITVPTCHHLSFCLFLQRPSQCLFHCSTFLSAWFLMQTYRGCPLASNPSSSVEEKKTLFLCTILPAFWCLEVVFYKVCLQEHYHNQQIQIICRKWHPTASFKWTLHQRKCHRVHQLLWPQRVTQSLKALGLEDKLLITIPIPRWRILQFK